jgi:hypothetical protein
MLVARRPIFVYIDLPLWFAAITVPFGPVPLSSAFLPRLTALFLKPQDILLAVMRKILEPKLGNRPRPPGGIGQRCQDQ